MKRAEKLHKGVPAAGLALAAFASSAFGADFPTRPVRLIMGYPAGSSGDLAMRDGAEFYLYGL